ncbi:prolyl oligopeptidase family serine peptidase [Treponema pedis]|uniref:prolyl oligopeptidase family serine peptidase n=1 Tax=Treponema pedis TaxID=409322 RepID=UPI000421901E|nr:prolyl oligopeptidase family serine peptidase [Treponema pedis]
MKKIIFLICMTVLIFSCGTENTAGKKKEAVKDNYFGTEVVDPYRWLEDDNAPEVIAWVKNENAKTDEFLSKIPFRDEFKKRLEKILNYERRSGFFKAGEYYYFSKTDGLQNQGIIYRQKNAGNAEEEAEVFFDPNTLSEDGTAALKSMSFSEDGKYMAYSVSKSGSDWEEIFVMDTEKKERLEDRIEWVKFSDLSWYKDGFFYNCYDAPEGKNALTEKNEFQKVKYHKLGTSTKDDKLIFSDDKNPYKIFSGIAFEPDGILFVIAQALGNEGNSLYIADLKRGFPEAELSFKQYNRGAGEAVSPAGISGKYLYLLTNEGTPFYKLVRTSIDNPSAENSEDVLSGQDYLLSSCIVTEDKILALYFKDVQNFAVVYDLNGKNPVEVKLPKNGSISYLGADEEDNTVYLSFTSYTTPGKIVKYDIKKNILTDFFVPSIDFNPNDYEAKQVFFTSKDGTKVPMHIVSKKGIKLDGNNPTLMYGYGGFGVALSPVFSPSIAVFLDAGGIYVCVNLRGGLEYGKEWHEAGKKMNKQNVFDDFIAAGEYLVENKYTSPEKLAIEGGSNGGLLIGAVTNQRPDLFAVAIPHVGVLDMLRYQHFTIGWAWIDEYGSSEESKEMFEYLYAYSPLHNIKPNVEYPAILIATGDHDDRVVPAHSFKYAQALHDICTSKKPILIRITENAGHGAGKPTAKIIEETADIYSFIFYQMGETL